MVTIAIPFYNDVKYLEMAIRSVINQTYKDWTLLLVDDGSSDGSLELAKQFAAQDVRITVFSDGRNKKLAYRLNQIANLAKTPYLARMDADDVMHYERIEKQLMILKTHPYIDVLGSNAYTIDSESKITGVRQTPSKEILAVDGFIHPSIMAKTQWFLDNPYDTNAARSQDALLWETTRQHSDFRITTTPFLFYREIGKRYYKKYWHSSVYTLKVLLSSQKKYKKTFLLKKISGSAFKSSLYFFMAAFRREKVLIDMRNKHKLTNTDLYRAQRFLKTSIESNK